MLQFLDKRGRSDGKGFPATGALAPAEKEPIERIIRTPQFVENGHA
jgi:hypothetical protein